MSEIDFDKRTWAIPATRMKARVEHVVPLTDEMLTVLRKAKQYNDSPYLFPGKGTRQGLSNNAFLQFLKKQFPDFEGTPHGIRSTFRDWAEEQGSYSHHAIETALAHQLKSKVERAYLRTNVLEQRSRLMSDWSTMLLENPDRFVVRPVLPFVNLGWSRIQRWQQNVRRLGLTKKVLFDG